MLRWRLISASILISALVLLIWLDLFLGSEDRTGRPGLILFPCAMIVGLMACGEVIAFLRTRHELNNAWAMYAGTAIVIGLSFVPLLWREYPPDCLVGRLGWPMFGMAAAVGIAFVSKMIGYRTGDDVPLSVGLTLVPVAYLGGLISFWLSIRSVVDNHWGMVAMISLFATVKVSDSAAYTVGKTMGRHKMAPTLSPGKTIEGLVGGIIGGCFGAAIVFYGVAPLITGESSGAAWWHVVIFGVCISIAGVLGDLAESLLKRSANVKDSSSWLPGLGGIMDLIDSVLAASPMAYALWVTGWFGPN